MRMREVNAMREREDGNFRQAHVRVHALEFEREKERKNRRGISSSSTLDTHAHRREFLSLSLSLLFFVLRFNLISYFILFNISHLF